MIKMYTKTVCPKCMVAKAFFTNNDVDFEVVNLDEDLESAEKLRKLNFMGVPIVEHEGKYYTNTAEFQELVDSL